jgi:hypothetical protein
MTDMESNRDVRHEPASIAAARRDVAATRERMSDTIAEFEAHVSGTVANVKRKVDVVTLVKENPWPALAAAFLAGVALSATGADRRAASVTASAARRAPSTAKQGATKAARVVTLGVSHLAVAAAGRFTGDSSDGAANDRSDSSKAGLVARLTSVVRAPRVIGEVLRSGVGELPNVSSASAETGANPT